MKAHVRLGQVLGIEVGLHISWFIITFLITLSLANQFYAFNPNWDDTTIWATAIATGLLLFDHALCAWRRCADRSRWANTTVEQAMRPLGRLPTVSPDTPIVEAIEIMEREGVNEVPVARNGRTEGFITRGGLMRLLKLRPVLEM